MAKAKKERLRLRRELQALTEHQSRPTRRYLRAFWVAVGAVATALSLYLAFYALRPKISISPGPQISANDFESPFIVRNDGLVPIYDVTPRCTILYAEDTRGNRFTSARTSMGVSAQRLGVGRDTTISCVRNAIGQGAPFIQSATPIARAEIAITVSFWAYFWPPHQEESQEFGARRDPGDKLVWYSTSRH